MNVTEVTLSSGNVSHVKGERAQVFDRTGVYSVDRHVNWQRWKQLWGKPVDVIVFFQVNRLGFPSVWGWERENHERIFTFEWTVSLVTILWGLAGSTSAQLLRFAVIMLVWLRFYLTCVPQFNSWQQVAFQLQCEENKKHNGKKNWAIRTEKCDSAGGLHCSSQVMTSCLMSAHKENTDCDLKFQLGSNPACLFVVSSLHLTNVLHQWSQQGLANDFFPIMQQWQ